MLGILLDRQPDDREHAGERDEDRDHPREDRPVDEEARQHAWLLHAQLLHVRLRRRFMWPSRGRGWRVVACDECHRVRLLAGVRVLQSFDDDAIAGDRCRPSPASSCRRSDRPSSLRHLHHAVGVDDQCGRIAAFVAADAALRHEQCIRFDAFDDARAHEHSGQQHAVRIRELRAQRHRAGGGIDRHFAETAACRGADTRCRRRASA